MTALVVANASVANASPLDAGRPAGVRQAQDRTTSMLAFGTGVIVLAGAGLAFSRMFNGSTDGTTIRITGGGVLNPTVIITTTSTIINSATTSSIINSITTTSFATATTTSTN